MNLQKTLKAVAGFEAFKGVLAIAGMLGLLRLLHHDLHAFALELIGHFHLNPQQHWPALLIESANHLSATPPLTIIGMLSVYAAMRFVEAWGLWHDQSWGVWFGILATGIYIPFELWHLWHHPTGATATVVAINLAVVTLMAARLREKSRC